MLYYSFSPGGGRVRGSRKQKKRTKNNNTRTQQNPTPERSSSMSASTPHSRDHSREHATAVHLSIFLNPRASGSGRQGAGAAACRGGCRDELVFCASPPTTPFKKIDPHDDRGLPTTSNESREPPKTSESAEYSEGVVDLLRTLFPPAEHMLLCFLRVPCLPRGTAAQHKGLSTVTRCCFEHRCIEEALQRALSFSPGGDGGALRRQRRLLRGGCS